MGTISTEPLGSELFCSECGRKYASQDLAHFGTSVVCLECKPRFVQRMQEGTLALGRVEYGGFWRRAAAIMLDGLIISAVYVPLSMMFSKPLNPAAPNLLAAFGLSWFLSIVFNLAYQVYFLSSKSATPGKMVMGLKVVTATGGRISMGRAAGRYFGYWVSSIILCIGYIMAAFDSEKRALHDHLCGTRVIRTS